MQNMQEQGLFLTRFYTMSIVVKIIHTSSDEKLRTVDNEMSIWMNENIIVACEILESRDYFMSNFMQLWQFTR
jgi:hypothetical protein